MIAVVLVVTPLGAFVFGWDRGRDLAVIALVLLMGAIAVESIYNAGRRRGR